MRMLDQGIVSHQRHAVVFLHIPLEAYNADPRVGARLVDRTIQLLSQETASGPPNEVVAFSVSVGGYIANPTFGARLVENALQGALTAVDADPSLGFMAPPPQYQRNPNRG